MNDKCMYIMALSQMAHFMWSCGLILSAKSNNTAGCPINDFLFQMFARGRPLCNAPIMQGPHWNFTKVNYSTLYGIASLKCVFRGGTKRAEGMTCDNTNV